MYSLTHNVQTWAGYLTVQYFRNTDVFHSIEIFFEKVLEIHVKPIQIEVRSSQSRTEYIFGLITGWLDWKLSKVNCSGSECGHFWPHVVKTKMCLRTGSFILIQVVFWVYEKYKWRNYFQFPTCFRGLVDRRVGCKAKGPRFKTYLGSIKKLNFYRNFKFFSTFSQNENSPYKTASPQTSKRRLFLRK